LTSTTYPLTPSLTREGELKELGDTPRPLSGRILHLFSALRGKAGFKSLLISLYQRENPASPFEKGGLRGISFLKNKNSPSPW
jgi:hypothetical protein